MSKTQKNDQSKSSFRNCRSCKVCSTCKSTRLCQSCRTKRSWASRTEGTGFDGTGTAKTSKNGTGTTGASGTATTNDGSDGTITNENGFGTGGTVGPPGTQIGPNGATLTNNGTGITSNSPIGAFNVAAGTVNGPTGTDGTTCPPQVTTTLTPVQSKTHVEPRGTAIGTKGINPLTDGRLNFCGCRKRQKTYEAHKKTLDHHEKVENLFKALRPPPTTEQRLKKRKDSGKRHGKTGYIFNFKVYFHKNISCSSKLIKEKGTDTNRLGTLY